MRVRSRTMSGCFRRKTIRSGGEVGPAARHIPQWEWLKGHAGLSCRRRQTRRGKIAALGHADERFCARRLPCRDAELKLSGANTPLFTILPDTAPKIS